MHAKQQINSLVFIIYSLFLWFPAEAFTCPTQKEKSTGTAGILYKHFKPHVGCPIALPRINSTGLA